MVGRYEHRILSGRATDGARGNRNRSIMRMFSFCYIMKGKYYAAKA